MPIKIFQFRLHFNLLIYFILLALHVVLVWTLPYFPTQDGPDHLYHLMILHDLLNGGNEWGEFFTFNFKLVPNLGLYIIAYPLLHLFSPPVVERLFLSIYIVFLGTGFLYFLYIFKKPLFPYAYFIFAVMFNFSLMLGSFSYVIGVVFLLYAMALSWKFRFRSPIYQFILFNFLGISLFAVHLIPCCLFIVFILLTLLFEHGGIIKKQRLVKMFLVLSPSMTLLIYYILSSKAIQITSLNFTSSSGGSIADILVERIKLFFELFLFSTDVLSRWQILPVAIVSSFFMIFIYESYKKIRNNSDKKDKLDISKKILGLFVAIMIIIYFVAPFRWGNGSFFNQRFPWLIFLFSIPLLEIPDKSIFKRFNAILMTIILFLFLINSVVFYKESLKVNNYLAGLKVEIPEKAFVLGYKKPEPQWARVDILLHAISYYAISKKLVNLNFYQAAWSNLFLINFNMKPENIPHLGQIEVAPETINWSLYPEIQYIFGYRMIPPDKKKLAQYFKMIFKHEDLTIWERYLK